MHIVHIQSCSELDFEDTIGFLSSSRIRRYKIWAKQTLDVPPCTARSFSLMLTEPLTRQAVDQADQLLIEPLTKPRLIELGPYFIPVIFLNDILVHEVFDNYILIP